MRAKLSWKVGVLVGAACLMTPQQPVMAQELEITTIDEIVMYAVESSDPARLMRYFFLSDTFTPIGEVWTTEGEPVYDVEALSYVPQGPYKGLYGVATDGPTEQYLTRIDPLRVVPPGLGQGREAAADRPGDGQRGRRLLRWARLRGAGPQLGWRPVRQHEGGAVSARPRGGRCRRRRLW
ncbi:MAG: hypothetical protein ACYTGM_20720 [Planctomycetota bacterium]